MAHVYSIGTLLGYPGSAQLADSAINGLMGELHDDEHGGWYSGITSDNQILPDKQCYAQFMEYLDEKVLDHEHGSWFHQLDAQNHLLDTVWPGKSDLYHAFQATLIPYSKVDVSIACYVKEKMENI